MTFAKFVNQLKWCEVNGMALMIMTLMVITLIVHNSATISGASVIYPVE